MRSQILGTGMHVPAAVVDNHRMSRIMDTSDAWIQQRTGIVTRRFAADGEASSDLAVPAAEAALTDAGVGKDTIDYVVFATMNPDYYFPGTAALSGPTSAGRWCPMETSFPSSRDARSSRRR